jgi:hypothetical protein
MCDAVIDVNYSCIVQKKQTTHVIFLVQYSYVILIEVVFIVSFQLPKFRLIFIVYYN